MGLITRQRRITLLLMLFLLCGFFLILKLFSIQILQSPSLTAGSIHQRMVTYQLDSGRGDILDREGIPLTGVSRDILIAFPFLITDSSQVKEELSGIFSREELEKIEEKIQTTSDKKAVLIAPTENVILTQGRADKIKQKEIPGIILSQENLRFSPDNPAVHLVGQLDRQTGAGVSGIELMFQKELKSVGPELLAVFLDGMDRVLPGLGYRHISPKESMSPLHVKLTIDSPVQSIVEEKMDRYIERGTVVVMEPKNGDILAMASRDKPPRNDLNYALQNFFPASVFKVVVAAAALEKGDFTMNSQFTCSGSIEVGSNTVDCPHGPHGEITLSEALAYSCNPAFVEIGLEIGGSSIIEYAQKLGFSERTGLYPYPHEERETKSGKLPDYDELLSPAGISNAVLGQHQVKATPLQIAQLFSTIANDGRMVSPRVVMELTTSRGVAVQKFSQDRGRVALLPSTAKQLKRMMIGVTRFGTGRAASVQGYVTAGKTGTTDGDGYSWFAGFTPVEYPEAVVVVYIEKSKQERNNAAFVYGEIMDEILKLKRDI